MVGLQITIWKGCGRTRCSLCKVRPEFAWREWGGKKKRKPSSRTANLQTEILPEYEAGVL